MVIQSAADTLLQSIDELLAGQDDALVMPMTTLNKATATIYEKNAKVVSGLQSKILKALDKATTRNLDAMDGPLTTALKALDMWQFDIHFLLQQLSTKCGFTKTGEPLEAALMNELAEGPRLGDVGTLVLSLGEAGGFLKELIHVLREIRDRLPAFPIHVLGEKPSGDEEIDEQPPDEPQFPEGPGFNQE